MDGEGGAPQRPHAPDGYYWNLRANGGVLSTVADLTRWTDALLAGEVLGPEALERYLTPHVPEGLGSDGYYAYGWAVENTPVGRLVWHTGGNGFFFAEVRRYIEADLLLVLLSNESNAVADTLATELAAAVLPELPSPDELPQPEPLAIDREESFEDATQTFTESIELTDDRTAGVAAFFVELEAGSASYRLLAPGGDVFDEKKIRRLIELMNEHDLNEIDLREGEMRVRLRKRGEMVVASAPAPMAHAAPAAPAPTAATAAPAAAATDNFAVIKSPMVGTFYSAPNPESPAFTKVGDHVGNPR